MVGASSFGGCRTYLRYGGGALGFGIPFLFVRQNNEKKTKKCSDMHGVYGEKPYMPFFGYIPSLFYILFNNMSYGGFKIEK